MLYHTIFESSGFCFYDLYSASESGFAVTGVNAGFSFHLVWLFKALFTAQSIAFFTVQELWYEREI